MLNNPVRNLAGITNCDELIEYELERMRIPAVRVEKSQGEVPYTLIGKLPGFTFTRAWNYWVVEGAVPLPVAEELFIDSVGKDDIRVNGMAGNAPPKRWAYPLLPDDLPEEVYLGPALSRQELEEAAPEGFCLIPGERAAILGAKPYVIKYHIDSEVGLRVFVDTLRTHDLVAEPVAA